MRSALRRLGEGKALRRAIRPWGRIHIERPLPFLVVYRRPSRRNDPDTHRLVLGEASYLLATGHRAGHSGLLELVQGVAATATEAFGAFLLVEVWAAMDDPESDGDSRKRAAFRILRPLGCRLQSTVDVLDWSLGQIRVRGTNALVGVEDAARVSPPSMLPLLTPAKMRDCPWHFIGLEVRPVFRNLSTGEDFPLVRRVLHRGMTRALKRSTFQFIRGSTSLRPAHFHALGRRRVVKAVWAVDRHLAEVSSTFDFLLQVTPVNVDQAWNRFRAGGCEVAPEFVSRPLSVDPALVKRKLYQVPIEEIEDPTLAQLFRDQQVELDRRLTMLGDRGTAQFLYGSLQLYGGVEPSLLATATDLLEEIPPGSREAAPRGALGAREFARLAEEHIEKYRRARPDLAGRVQVRKDLVGLMVSRGVLLVGSSTRIPESRVQALLAHEVGTHVLTYVNGRAQPFRQLYIGLPGYDELQEGLAVLAEYLVGGLSRPRLRLLAGRVKATDMMVEGAGFVELHRELVGKYGFPRRTGFHIAMRVLRGGGLTKDAVYLRGLVALLEYVRLGGGLDPLIVGKVGLQHVPIVEELKWRRVLQPPPLRPLYLDDPAAGQRLEELRKGASALDLAKRRRR